MKNRELHNLIHKVSFNSKNRVKIFQRITPDIQRMVILRLPEHLQYEILTNIPQKEVINLLENMETDEATDVIQIFPKKTQEEIVKGLDENLRHDIRLLLSFDPNTAAGLMSVDYIRANANETIAEIVKRYKVHEKKTGHLPAIIVTENEKVIGYIPGHELGFAKPFEPAKKFVRKIMTIPHLASHDNVIEIFRNYPHNKVVVVGEKENPIGIIYSDDVLRELKERESASLYDFAGLNEEESVSDSVGRKVKFRYKWLIINLATAFLAAFTVGLFDKTIGKYVLLAAYMPIVAGMGGNAATQTLAVLVRGISLKEIEFKNSWKTLKNEVGAAFINGVINGIIVAVVVWFLNHDWKFALVLASAMVINLVVAGAFGTLVPLIMKKLNKDPASSATIFITTATDVLGFLVFLGLATLVLA